MIINTNPDGGPRGKAKGHLGTILGQGCETQLILEEIPTKPPGILVRCGPYTRNVPFKDFVFELRKGVPYVTGDYENLLDY